MAIQYIPEIICEPGAQNIFGVDSTWVIENYTAGTWDGSSGALTSWFSDTSNVPVNISVPAGITVRYSFWKDINNTGPTINASDPTNVNGGDTTGISFTALFITSTPSTSADPGAPYIYNPTVNGSATAWNFTNAPAGMTVNPSTGRIYWIPSYSQSSPVTATLNVTDGTGSALQTWSIVISSKNKGPWIY